MKRLVMVAVLVLLSSDPAVTYAPHGVGISFGVFYSSLDPYGEWITIRSGTQVWRPLHVAVTWRPYFHGRWVWTDDGWYWVSEEPWSWAVYHYGRWDYDSEYGWVWIPGYDWAPAWVEWRMGGSCVGWAPLGSYAAFRAGFGVYFTHSWMIPANHWTFVDARYIDAPNVYRYVYPVGSNYRYVSRTSRAGSVVVEGGRIVTRGPGRQFVEEKTGHRIRRAEMVDVRERSREGYRPGGGHDMLRVYRPEAVTPGGMLKRSQERPGRVREADRRPLSELGDTKGMRERKQGPVLQRSVPGRKPEPPRASERPRIAERSGAGGASSPGLSRQQMGSERRAPRADVGKGERRSGEDRGRK
jgi:Family of unknown function (DUF6600)